MKQEMHDLDPRKGREFWCTTCKRSHEPTEEHPICDADNGINHLHAKPPKDLFIDFRGWRWTAPFICFYCGIEVCFLQWAFSRSCGGCDVSNSHTARLRFHQCFAGPHELRDKDDSLFIPEDRMVDPGERDKHPVLNPRREPFPPVPFDRKPFPPLHRPNDLVPDFRRKKIG